jgi:hypothetical protein
LKGSAAKAMLLDLGRLPFSLLRGRAGGPDWYIFARGK